MVVVSTAEEDGASVEAGAMVVDATVSEVEDPQEETSNKADTMTARYFISSVCHLTA